MLKQESPISKPPATQ